MGSNKNYHYFYKITNLINGHFYYGVHNTDDLDDGYMGSGSRLGIAYKKYGVENFKKEILVLFDTSEEAFEYESEIVNEQLISDPKCYNIVSGGIGGYKPTDKDLSGIDFGTMRGKLCVKYKNTEEYFIINRDEYDPEIHEFNWNGKHHSEKSKNKIREKMTPKNSNNDRIWVCKDGVVKYIRKEKLQSFLDNGWKLGRTGYKPRKGMMGVKIDS